MTATIRRTLQGTRVVFDISLEARESGGWYVILLSGAGLRADPLVSLAVEDVWASGASARCFAPIRIGKRVLTQISVIFVPAREQRMEIEVDGEHPEWNLRLRLIAVSQATAALALVALQPSIVLPSGREASRRGHTTLRKRLALASIKLGPRISYPLWQRRYDRWEMLPATDLEPRTVMTVVFSQGEQDRDGLNATLASIAGATEASLNTNLPVTVIRSQDGSGDDRLQAALNAGAAEFVIVLQAGEVIVPYAIDALVRFAVTKQLSIVYADEDHLDFAGNRSAPVFKPEPSCMLMLSGTLTTGIFLIRRTALAGLSGEAAQGADTLRLAAWLRLKAKAVADGNAVFSGRLPLLLTHRRPDIAATAPERIATIAHAYLGSAWIGEIDAARLPLRIRPGVGTVAPKVSLIIASTGRLEHVRSCLAAVLEQTRYPDFEMIIVLSQSTPLDPMQNEVLAPVLSDPRVRLVFAPMERFNYSKANNVAITHSKAPLICLLNDDVAPITPDWLTIMVGHLQDPYIAAVGAKLYYPEATVQHGGVIMGLAGLCDHSFRFLPRANDGYAARAIVEQELSAVTGACMLIRRPVFDEVRGLDEHFASAFNDVDLCLKIRAAGHGIIWSAQAELWHHETISFGQHYADEHKAIADRDIGIMRARWAAECEMDPFHNPNLSLEAQSEWELAFPPRLGRLPAAAGLIARD